MLLADNQSVMWQVTEYNPASYNDGDETDVMVVLDRDLVETGLTNNN